LNAGTNPDGLASPAPPEAESVPVRRWAKRYLPGRMAAALWRRRRTPLLALAAERAERRDRRAGSIPPPLPRRREVLAVVCIPSGPGDPERILDTIDSIRASDGDTSQILVVDDCSVTAREAVIRQRFPEVEVVRTRMPSGGLPNIWPPLRTGIEHALAHYDFSLFVKFDTDAIATGPDFSTRSHDALAAAPEAGLAGSFRTRADGRPEDHVYHADVLERELPHDPCLALAARRAQAAGWRPGDTVQGGVTLFSRVACERLRDEGWLDWPRPWHSNIAEDFAVTIFVRACGLEALSVGDPESGLLAVAAKGLPLPKQELAGGPWVAAHSTRVGLHGESESELRDYFRAQRAGWPNAGARAAIEAGRS